VARALRDHGLEAMVMVGGLQAWKKAGQALEAVPAEDIVQLPKFAR
jgi:rhodanese-related sulfurtransferase